MTADSAIVVADTVRDFERYLNKKHQTGKLPVTVYLIPTTRDRLLPDVAAGLGDIAAGNLTVTPERLELVDFVAPEDQKGIAEIVVTGPKSAPVEKVEDLSGRKIHVCPSSSYYESLQELNQRLKAEGRPEAIPVPVPDTLEDEDLLEMVNAGPGNIAKMCKLAGHRGLDPDKLFNNVEIVVAEKIGQETTTYVRNIYKYYVAYRLTLEAEEAAKKAREQVSK